MRHKLVKLIFRVFRKVLDRSPVGRGGEVVMILGRLDADPVRHL